MLTPNKNILNQQPNLTPNSALEKDFDQYLVDKFPKLSVPLKENLKTENIELNTNPINEHDIYEVININFNYDNLYLKEAQLSDFQVIEAIAQSCIPFLTNQQNLLKQNYDQYHLLNKDFKEFKLNAVDLKLAHDNIKKKNVKDLNTLDQLIRDGIDTFNIKFNKFQDLYRTIRAKKLKFFEKVEADSIPKKQKQAGFDINLFFQNSTNNLQEMINRIQESLVMIRTVPNSQNPEVQRSFLNINEFREEMVQHFEDIRGVMRDVYLTFEHLYIERREMLNALYADFDQLYVFSNDVNNNITSILKLVLIKDKRLQSVHQNLRTLNSQLLKINVPLSLVSSQNDIENIESSIQNINRYLLQLKKDLKIQESASDTLYLRYMKVKTIQDTRDKLQEMQNEAKDSTEVIRLFGEIAKCEKTYSANFDQVTSYNNKYSELLKGYKPLTNNEKNTIAKESHKIMCSIDSSMATLRKIEKIPSFKEYVPIATQLRKKFQEKYDEVFKMQQLLIEKINNAPVVLGNVDTAEVTSILTTAESLINKNSLVTSPKNYIKLVNSLSTKQVDMEMDRLLSMIKETQSCVNKLEKLQQEEPNKVKPVESRVTVAIMRLKYDVDNGRFIHLVFDDINFFNYDNLRAALYRLTSQSDNRPLEDIRVNLNQHVKELKQAISQRASDSNKDLTKIGELRSQFEEKAVNILDILKDSMKSAVILDEFIESNDHILKLMDQQYFNGFDQALKKASNLQAFRKDIEEFSAPDDHQSLKELINQHNKNLSTHMNCDLKLYEDLVSKLNISLTMFNTHNNLIESFLQELKFRPNGPQQKCEMVERVKSKIYGYEKFYDDAQSLAEFFKNYGIHKSFKKIENMDKYSQQIRNFAKWDGFFKSLLKVLKDTEILDEDPDDDFGMGVNKMVAMENFNNVCKNRTDLLPEQLNILPFYDKFLYKCFQE